MIDREVLRKNRFLFLLSVSVFMQIIFSGALLLSYSKLFSSFYNLSLQKNLGSINWSFIDYIWKSGESMSVHGNVFRLKGFQNKEIVNFIGKFFLDTGWTDVNKNVQLASSSKDNIDIERIIEHFSQFNTQLQLSVINICCLALFSLTSISIFITLLFKYLAISKPFYLYKLFLSSLFSIWGFYLAILWERRLLEMGLIERIEGESKLIRSLFISRIYRDWKSRKDTFKSSSDSEDLIVVKNLYFSPDSNMGIRRLFNRNKEVKYILKDINLNIKRGSFNVIIGPNGSGKTTLIKSLVNLYESSKGEILWNGVDVSRINKTTFSKHVSYIPQFLNIEHSISVIDFLSFSRYPYKDEVGNSPDRDREKVIESLRLSGCEDFGGKMIDELSGGQRQKILLTSVLSQESNTIVLDEPTSFLDIKNQHRFLETLRSFNRNGKTIIMILHDIQQAINYADNLIVVEGGRIKASGDPLKIVTEELLKDIFKIGCSINRINDSIEISNIYSINV